MLNCSVSLPLSEKQSILSTFSQKLRNSGFSLASSQIILVHGVTRYLELVRKSELPPDHKDHKPLYWTKDYKRLQRKLTKFEAKSGWYRKSDDYPKVSWRSLLSFDWKGSKPIQLKVPGMDYTTVLQVPSSKGSVLLKEIAKIEPILAKSTGYHMKLVEKSGKPLLNLFSENPILTKCHREDCHPCKNKSVKGNSLCGLKNVVYEATCDLCLNEHIADPTKANKGVYIGQTYRTLYERSLEHFGSLRRMESGSFMFKHWAIHHPSLPPPQPSILRLLNHLRTPLAV